MVLPRIEYVVPTDRSSNFLVEDLKSILKLIVLLIKSKLET